MMDRYTIYGNLSQRDTIALMSILIAKGLDFDFVEETASLSFLLASRAGSESGPYLRTAEGFVLSDLHAILNWIERIHPYPTLCPDTPVRDTVTRLLEDWVELWLPLWPRRSWSTLDGLGRHLESSGFLLGGEPTRPDFLLAAWLETEVFVREHAKERLSRTAPRLAEFGADLLDTSIADRGDDVIPISLLSVFEEIRLDYHGFLLENHRACKDGLDRVFLDLGLGRRAMPSRPDCEARRAEIGQALGRRPKSARRDVRQVLEPVGLWHVLTLPPIPLKIDPADPRNL